MTRVVVPLLLVCAIVVAVVALRGEDPMEVSVPLTTANGLRDGTSVKVGSADVGKITAIDIADGDRIVAKLEIDRDDARLRRDATAQVVTSNLLGSKYIQLTPGRDERELADGGTIRRVGYPVDLDEVLGVLDGETRVRLAQLIDELGTAITGRKADFGATLRLLPRDVRLADQLLRRVVADNHSLRRTVEQTSRFVSRLAPERRTLTELVDTAGEVMQSVAERRTDLARTLDAAPPALGELRATLAELDRATRPLEPAARLLHDSAGPLRATLTALPGFTDEARPTLRQADAAAPLITRLARGATPVLRSARPTLASLDRLAGDLPRAARAVDVSIDDALGVLEGWARSIQTRDRTGHFFRGFATISPDTIRSAVNVLEPTAPASRRDRRRRPATKRPAAPAPAVPPAAPAPQAAPPRKPLLPDLIDKTTDQVEQLLDTLTGGPRQDGAAPDRERTAGLLDFLIGR